MCGGFFGFSDLLKPSNSLTLRPSWATEMRARVGAGANVGVTNDGTIKVNAGELDIVHETVTNTDGAVSVAAGSTLELVNSIISGGAVGIDGTLKAIGHSAIDGATVDVADSGVVSVGLTSTLDLVDAIIKGGTINVASV